MAEIKFLFYSMRPQQWIKNCFVFLPLIFGSKLFDMPDIAAAGGAFLIFSIAASAVYIFNDIIDFKADRSHPVKRLRPIASGKVSRIRAGFLASILSISNVGLSYSISPALAYTVLLYIAFNFFYTIYLKKVVIIDIFCIALFFLLRLMAGCIAVDVRLSPWIISCTALLALFIGFNKRRHELGLLRRKAGQHRPVLEQYSQVFIDQMIGVITASVVIMYTLYTVDATTIKKFGTGNLFYSIPFVYYGIFRYLFLVHKRHKGGDPIRILLSDRPMQADLILWLVVCIIVIYRA